MNRIVRIGGSPRLYFTLFWLFFFMPVSGQEIGLISMGDEGIPSYLLQVGEGLVSAAVEELLGGAVLSGDDLRRLQEAEGAGEREIGECRDLVCARELAAALGLEGMALFSLTRSGGGYLLSLQGISADGTKQGRAEDFFIDIRNYDATVAEVGRDLAVQMGLIEAAIVRAPDQKTPEETGEPFGTPSEEATSGLAEADEMPAKSELPEAASLKPEFSPPVRTSSGERLFTAGIGLYQLGGLANMLALMSDGERVSSDYLARNALLPSERDSYEKSEEFYRTAYTISSAAAWTLHAAAPLTAGFPLAGGNVGDLRFSTRGKWYLYAGIGSAMAGHLLYLDSIDPLAEGAYLRARGDSDSYYSDEYDREFPWLVARQGTVLGLWTLGNAAVMAAPAQPGKRVPLASNFWDRVLVGSGLALFSGGNVFASLAGMRRTEALEDWFRYQEISSPARYSAWEKSFDSFEFNRNLALGFWLGGAFCLALAELADFPDPFDSGQSPSDRDSKEGDSPRASLRFLPRPDGGSLFLHFAFQ
jgi:hypothetical protein